MNEWRVSSGGCIAAPDEDEHGVSLPKLNLSMSVFPLRSADGTDTRLSWRRAMGACSVNPLKLTTLAGLCVDGTDGLRVTSGSRMFTPPMKEAWAGLGDVDERWTFGCRGGRASNKEDDGE